MEFYQVLQKNPMKNWIDLHSLRFFDGTTEFQLDHLIICPTKVYLIEMKNYEGDYFIQNGNWYTAARKKEIRNPLHQLKRSEIMLRHQLQELGYNHPIESFVIFINPAFTLYQAPMDLPIILPTQIKRFVNQLNRSGTSSTITEHQKRLTNLLIARNRKQSAYEKLPQYHFEQMKKGIICHLCTNFLSIHGRKKLICESCGYMENFYTGVLRSILEFQCLFPNKKITVNTIHEWCELFQTKSFIRRMLKKYLISVGTSRKSTYYIFEGEREK